MGTLYKQAEELEVDQDEASHLHVQRGEDGQPLLARFTYVDEATCIGCRYCASVARNTFFMEDDYGRARVYNQDGDTNDLIMEAIDSCPVNCIHYVSWEDLVILEQEREGTTLTANNYGNFKQKWIGGGEKLGQTSAKFYDNAGVRCNNCPSRGCKECPMFGVGENPVYLERLAEREERRRLSGEAKKEEELRERTEMIEQILSAPAGDLNVDDVEVEANEDAPTGIPEQRELSDPAVTEEEERKRTEMIDQMLAAAVDDLDDVDEIEVEVNEDTPAVVEDMFGSIFADAYSLDDDDLDDDAPALSD